MILNIAAYLFVAVDDADALAPRIHARAEADALRGSVLVTPEGLNLFLAGEEASLHGFVEWLREDARFSGLHAKESWSEAVPFAKLKVKRKRPGALPKMCPAPSRASWVTRSDLHVPE